MAQNLRNLLDMTDSTWRVPGYVVERVLGTGGSGEVWRARVKATGEPVALKRIPVRDRPSLLAARSEAAILSALDHRHLIRLHDCIVDSHGAQDAVVLVLDLAAGGSLAQLLERRGRLTCGEAVTALAPVGAAIAYAHGAGVVHGDITPANILFTEAGVPMLADLGVARLRGELTAVRSTPAYLDPAVAAGSLPTSSSDVFMLGAVAVHVLTGGRLWCGDTAEQLLVSARHSDLSEVPARLAAAQVPESVCAVVLRALAVDPAQRGTAADFALDLRHSCQPAAVELTAGRADDPGLRPAPTYGIGPSSRGPLPARGERSRRRRVDPRVRRFGLRRRRVVVLAGAICVTAALAGAVVLVWPRTAAPAAGSGVPLTLSPGTTTPTAAASTSSPTPAPKPESTSVSASAVPTVLDLASATQVLLALDRTRANAFAARDATLLARIYPSGPLLAQDTALLQKLVPVGCGLIGVHTSYRAVHVLSRRPGQTIVQATAELAASALVCAGNPVAKADSSGPARLRITLVRAGTRYLISDITR